MANVVQQFRSLNAFVRGEGYPGRLEEFHPARLQIMTAEHHPAGMDAPVYLDMGMENPTARLVFNGYHGQILDQFGLADANAVDVIVKGGLEDYDGTGRLIQFEMTGNIIDMPFGRIRGRGEVPKMILQIACTHYKIDIDGRNHIEIDVLNYKRIIGGIDRLENLRNIIGLTAA